MRRNGRSDVQCFSLPDWKQEECQTSDFAHSRFFLPPGARFFGDCVGDRIEMVEDSKREKNRKVYFPRGCDRNLFMRFELLPVRKKNSNPPLNQAEGEDLL